MSEHMQEVKKEKLSDKTLYIMGFLVIVFIAFLFTNGFGIWGGNGGDSSVLSKGESPVLGKENAPVTVYVFSDFSCPYCAAAAGFNQPIINSLKSRDSSWTAPIPEIIDKYVNTGKVQLVFKYSPGHGTGQPAHRVAWCLNEQNLFWEFHDGAFENQEYTKDMVKMKSLALGIGADMAKLETCLNSGRIDGYFEKDTQMGIDAGITGTPAIFVNGKLIEGAQSFSVVSKEIEKGL